MHVPLDRKEDFDRVREFAQGVADLLAASDPKRYTTEQRQDRRQGRLFLDVMRNAYAQTAVPSYAVRARRGAPVATPLDWTRTVACADRFTIHTVPQRIERDGDPWRGVGRRRRSLGTARRRLDRLLAEDAARTGARL